MRKRLARRSICDPKTANWSLLAASRFALAFIVVCVHINFFYPNILSSTIAEFGGKAAVVGFFVISGYSVSASYDQSAQGFLYRRFLRIFPAYLFVVLAALVLQSVLGRYSAPNATFEAAGLIQVIGNFLMLQMFVVKTMDFNGPAWSLSIEFSYYIFLLYLTRTPNWCIWAIVAASVILFILPRDLSSSYAYATIMKANMIRYFWPFLLGVLLQRSPTPRLFVAAGLIGAVIVYFGYSTYERYSALTYLLTLAVLAIAHFRRGVSNAFFDFLGEVSYPLYLIHLPLFIAISAYTPLRDANLYAALAIFVAAAVMFFIERPFRNLLRRLLSIRFHSLQRV